MSIIDSGISNINNSIFNLIELMKYCGELHSKLAKEKGLNFSLIIPKNIKNIIVKIDKDKLHQIISNLLNNSLKFTEKGEIELIIENEKNNIVIKVKDTGIGIAKENMNKIFDRFWQNENENTDFQSGTGLGLSICKGLANELGFNILVESELGKGSTFSIVIPKNDNLINSELLRNKKAPEDYQFDNNNYKILIAEDDDINYAYLNQVLLKANLKTDRANNGKEAVDKTFANQYDLILMDIKMPLMNGLEASRIIKNKYPETVVIAQTAYALPEEVEKVKRTGFDNILKKPINKGDLLKTLSYYIKK